MIELSFTETFLITQCIYEDVVLKNYSALLLEIFRRPMPSFSNIGSMGFFY
jgi:hypothetical protein